jgi:hypothetical protein
MKAFNLRSLLFVGTLALFEVSCKEEKRNNDRYDADRRDRDYTDVRGDRDYSDDRDKTKVYKEVSYTSTVNAGREMLIGDGDKAWKARVDLNDTGLDEAMEREGVFYFYSNNTFTLVDKDQTTRSGKWSYNGATLSIQYSGDASSSTFAVRELTNNRMRLGAYDGSELVLVDKDEIFDADDRYNRNDRY